MVAQFDSQDWRDWKVREWLLLLLRFAVTREPSDRSATLAVADELDSVGLRWRPGAPRFFLRTSNDVCDAILAVGDNDNAAVLRTHVARIQDLRLRRAFQAAIDLRQPSETQQRSTKSNRREGGDLWKGLPEH